MKRGGSFFFSFLCLIQINTLNRRNWKRNKTFFLRKQKSLPDICSSERVFLLICEFKNEIFHGFYAWMFMRIHVSVFPWTNIKTECKHALVFKYSTNRINGRANSEIWCNMIYHIMLFNMILSCLTTWNFVREKCVGRHVWKLSMVVLLPSYKSLRLSISAYIFTDYTRSHSESPLSLIAI